MFDFPIQPARLHGFVANHAEALQNASLLLSGRPWLRRTQRLIDDMRTQPHLTRRMRHELVHLCDLLNLEHVHDLDRPEAGYFAEIDPDAPCVIDICILAEALSEAVADVGGSPFSAQEAR
jgi:hypothetical protein